MGLTEVFSNRSRFAWGSWPGLMECHPSIAPFRDLIKVYQQTQSGTHLELYVRFRMALQKENQQLSCFEVLSHIVHAWCIHRRPILLLTVWQNRKSPFFREIFVLQIASCHYSVSLFKHFRSTGRSSSIVICLFTPFFYFFFDEFSQPSRKQPLICVATSNLGIKPWNKALWACAI